MHLIRDEEETLNQFIDELADLFNEGEDKLPELFRGPSYNVRYKLDNNLPEEDE